MNRRGSAIVEASMVFPIMLLSLMAVIYMMIYFYNNVGEQVKLHTALRAESGSICENFYYTNRADADLTVYKQGRKIYGFGRVEAKRAGILQEKSRSIRAEKYLIDETMIVRIADLTGTERNELQ